MYRPSFGTERFPLADATQRKFRGWKREGPPLLLPPSVLYSSATAAIDATSPYKEPKKRKGKREREKKKVFHDTTEMASCANSPRRKKSSDRRHFFALLVWATCPSRQTCRHTHAATLPKFTALFQHTTYKKENLPGANAGGTTVFYFFLLQKGVALSHSHWHTHADETARRTGRRSHTITSLSHMLTHHGDFWQCNIVNKIFFPVAAAAADDDAETQNPQSAKSPLDSFV